MESGLPEVVKERSIQVFTELGEAEAKTHGSTLDQVKPFVRACPSCATLRPVRFFASQRRTRGGVS